MTVYGGFAAPTLGMRAQAHAMNIIGVNIANVNTGGFKRTETQFQTVLSNTYFEQSDIGGLKPKDFQNVATMGTIQSSSDPLHASINGSGFFVLNTAIDGSGQTYYGRDGAFEMATSGTSTATGIGGDPITVKNGYLTDKNGFFVMGYGADPNTGLIDTSSTPTAMRIDPFVFNSSFVSTTSSTAKLNLPATDAVGNVQSYYIDMYDSAGDQQSASLTFTKAGTNSWTLTTSTGNPADTVNSGPATLTFNANGGLVTPSSYTVDVTWDGGTTSSVAVDISNITQYAGDFTVGSYTKNGYGKADMTDVYWDTEGHVVGDFKDNTSRILYQVPLAVFSNPNRLLEANGNVFTESSESGEASMTLAGSGGYALISPNSRELSNVDIAGEFTRMIAVQNAYNSSATAFRTSDEMLEEAGNMKR